MTRSTVLLLCLAVTLTAGLRAQDKPTKPPKDPEFQDLYIATFDDGKTTEIRSFLRFEKDQFVVSPMKAVKKDQPDPTVQWPYETISSADFIIDKPSTTGATFLVGAGLAGSGGLNHYLTVKTKGGEYIVLHLSMDTYRFILAELEKRAKIKVAIAGAK
jgi:hypothetical protein